jgi:hypothetical protein
MTQQHLAGTHIGLGLRGSSQRLIQCLTWCLPSQGLPRAVIKLRRHIVEVTLRNRLEVGSAGKVLAQQPR